MPLAKLYGGPACGCIVSMLEFSVCVEFIRADNCPTLYIGNKGEFAPNNLPVWFDRYIYEPKSGNWTYRGRFNESFYSHDPETGRRKDSEREPG